MDKAFMLAFYRYLDTATSSPIRFQPSRDRLPVRGEGARERLMQCRSRGDCLHVDARAGELRAEECLPARGQADPVAVYEKALRQVWRASGEEVVDVAHDL